MTAPARISQADMERATKAVKSAGYERARIVMNLESRTIEVIIGDVAAVENSSEEWADDDI